MQDHFLEKVKEIIQLNLSNDQFGVSDLAREIGMSRSNLLRKLKKETDLSVSQYIRKVRLAKAKELLGDTSLSVSEISYQVGFSSPSYFIKCFKEEYGESPGKLDLEEVATKEDPGKPAQALNKRTIMAAALFAAVATVLVFSLPKFFDQEEAISEPLEKSIAVLPFINDSNDSSNIYLINGLMESVLNNLQKINDLRVISRTSVEKYRNSIKTIPEIAEELNVSYFVEGSGQKIGNKVRLTIQLIQASNDEHLWSKQYDREINEIFDLQLEVAQNITREIEVIITPEEQERINKVPTANLKAYDYYLKGLAYYNYSSLEGFEEAIELFEKAISLDTIFAEAYANIAMSYYCIDLFTVEKQYTSTINTYADKALLLDPKLSQALIAKGFYYMHTEQLPQAEPYLEKALEYNPNSAIALNALSNYYANYVPNTTKYLEYALRGVRLDIAQDSITSSFIHLHISNALIQAGFIDESLVYIDRSLGYNPENIFSAYVRAYILLAKDRDPKITRDMLVEILKKDTTRLDVVQELGKIHYVMEDYERAYFYYQAFLEAKEKFGLEMFPGEDIKIAFVMDKLGFKEKSEELFSKYKEFIDKDQSIYKHLGLAAYYYYYGEIDKGLQHLREFSKEEDYHFWTVTFLKNDPIFADIKDTPEFGDILEHLEDKFWLRHEEIKTTLEEKKLI